MCDTRDEYLAESDALAIEPLRRHRNLTLRGSIFTFLTLRGSFLYIPNLRKKIGGSKLEKGGEPVWRSGLRTQNDYRTYRLP